MSRTTLFQHLARKVRVARFCDARGLRTEDGIAEYRRLEEEAHARKLGRREVLLAMGPLAAGALTSGTAPWRAWAARSGPAARVGIVGAGLAGLACADRLASRGVAATVHEAGTRVGGRWHSYGPAFGMPDLFPGQVAELGGELIDNLHKTMLGYVRRFNLEKEDLSKLPGETLYYFDGRHHPEAAIVDELRSFIAAMRDDLRTLSAAPTADAHNEADVALDYTDLETYLTTRQAGPVLEAAIIAAYEAEYGLEAWQQSSLNFLLFMHADKRSKFTPFGVFSDERYHVVDGNQRIAEGLASGLPNPVRLGERLVEVRRTSSGALQLTLQRSGGGTASWTYDAVVLALPFTVLRGVSLDASLGLPRWKTDAIQRLGYGTNAKMMLGFQGAFWKARGCNGSVYADLADVQTTWETNPSRATARYALLTDYSSGRRGARLRPEAVRTEAARFVSGLEQVLPGALHAVRQSQGRIVAHLAHWPSNPLSLGSYTCYTPGQFVTIAGHEGKPVGNLYFAGEHANSFYVWQGFAEGAALSGIDAADQVLSGLGALTSAGASAG